MTAADHDSDVTANARALLLKIHARCERDRYAAFPRWSKDILENGAAPSIVVFGTRGLGFTQQLDHIEGVIRLNAGMRISAVVADDAGSSSIGVPKVREYPTLSVEQFFEQAREYAGCIIVDRTCTWNPGVRHKMKLKQAGFSYLRVEQFLNAPGLSVGPGCYREHSDLMLARFGEFLALERHWVDAYSLQTYYYALAAFISMNHEYFSFHCGDYNERYFPKDVGLNIDQSAILADCGSHEGQEALYFARTLGGVFRGLHAFEPDRTNYRNLCRNVSSYIAESGATAIVCHELGVYDRNAYLASTGYGAGLSIADGQSGQGVGIHVCRLDDMLDEVTHLRLEIEGAELAALRGAIGIIRSDRPKMIVSAYHKATDFLDLTEFIEGADRGYQMRLRHQSLEPSVLCIYCV
jgi:FkbM family methyltransferase